MSLLAFAFARPILELMNTPKSNFDYALTYMRITCGMTIVMALYNGISSILRALGDSKTPLVFLVISSVMNVVLDFLFVKYLNFGVEGVAWATVISQAFATFGSIVFAVEYNSLFKLSKEHFGIDLKLIIEDLRIGLPMAFQTALIAISCALLQTLINGYGEKVMAAYTVTGKV